MLPLTQILERLRWRPGIGDPSIAGWLTVAAYLLAAMLAWRAWAGPPKGSRPTLWFWVALLMAALAINKQFDFQSLITDIGRVLAREGGWYKERRHLQKFFVIAVLAASVLAALGAAWWVGRSWRTRGLLAAGLLLLLSYVALRAVSFHHVDVLLRTRIGGAKFYWVLEWTGILLVALAALRTRSLQRR